MAEMNSINKNLEIVNSMMEIVNNLPSNTPNIDEMKKLIIEQMETIKGMDNDGEKRGNDDGV